MSVASPFSVLKSQLNAEKETRRNLAAAYRIFAHLKMDDLTYTHLSARVPNQDAYFIYPFGDLFEEVTASRLLKVSLDGEILEGSEFQYNKTGYIIHGSIYQARSEINAIFHLHTPAGVAVSAMPQGLMPISQFAFHFYNRIGAYHYDSLALDYRRQGESLKAALGTYKTLLLQNHGTLTCGETIEEAFLYMYFLERACQTQVAALSCGTPIVPSPEVCEKTAQDLRNFEPDFGSRDWTALMRIVETNYPDYKE
ncbi:Class II aldolase/adducin domain protein [Candidatus Bealeia paramacronuclearis]|uniref:Class II aldolase/adducin domain protein n=1 Tax=Candidatus Bealeia paramacronuclearis TaxID=1921001 RepID=A0ABZ2C7J1_9PROT|nr:Class II aldolase/adducin domain protein [Candidatus Bealeia paramacronuclearis]